MGKFKYGAVRDPEIAKSKSPLEVLGRTSLRVSVPNKMLSRSMPIEDQGGMSACVGYTLRRGIYMQTGVDASAVGIYKISRMLDRSGPGEPLIDLGCRPFFAYDGIHEFGVPLEKDEPSLASTVNDELDFGALRKSSVLRMTGFYRTSTYRPVEDWERCITADFPVAFTTEVTQAVEDHNGRTPLSRPEGKVFGLHYMLAIGFETIGGKKYFHIANSWGTKWGDAGYGIVTEDFVRATTDAYCASFRRTKAGE